jgi:hypothetical protein
VFAEIPPGFTGVSAIPCRTQLRAARKSAATSPAVLAWALNGLGRRSGKVADHGANLTVPVTPFRGSGQESRGAFSERKNSWIAVWKSLQMRRSGTTENHFHHRVIPFPAGCMHRQSGKTLKNDDSGISQIFAQLDSRFHPFMFTASPRDICISTTLIYSPSKRVTRSRGRQTKSAFSQRNATAEEERFRLW